MTKAHEKGENEFTRAARREALRTGMSVESILKRMLAAARRARDKSRQNKIIQALKFVKNRNPKKRKRRSK